MDEPYSVTSCQFNQAINSLSKSNHHATQSVRALIGHVTECVYLSHHPCSRSDFDCSDNYKLNKPLVRYWLHGSCSLYECGTMGGCPGPRRGCLVLIGELREHQETGEPWFSPAPIPTLRQLRSSFERRTVPITGVDWCVHTARAAGGLWQPSHHITLSGWHVAQSLVTLGFNAGATGCRTALTGDFK